MLFMDWLWIDMNATMLLDLFFWSCLVRLLELFVELDESGSLEYRRQNDCNAFSFVIQV